MNDYSKKVAESLAALEKAVEDYPNRKDLQTNLKAIKKLHGKFMSKIGPKHLQFMDVDFLKPTCKNPKNLNKGAK